MHVNAHFKAMTLLIQHIHNKNTVCLKNYWHRNISMSIMIVIVMVKALMSFHLNHNVHLLYYSICRSVLKKSIHSLITDAVLPVVTSWAFRVLEQHKIHAHICPTWGIFGYFINALHDLMKDLGKKEELWVRNCSPTVLVHYIFPIVSFVL